MKMKMMTRAIKKTELNEQLDTGCVSCLTSIEMTLVTMFHHHHHVSSNAVPG